ncbi:MAG: 30S ribosomal protein S16 [Nevskiales bacterium]
MVKIRLSRAGVKKRALYHIVVADQRFSRDGRYIERLGSYIPAPKGQEVGLQVNYERADFWLGKGAQASERVAALLKEGRKSVAAQ